MDYSLGLFGAFGPEVIFHGGVMRHMDPTWHAYMALGHIELASSVWHVRHVTSSLAYFIGRVFTLEASYVIFSH